MRSPSIVFRSHWLVIPVAVIGLSAMPASADECPQSCLDIVRSGEVCSSRAAADTVFYFSLGGCGDSASYSIPEGVLTAGSTRGLLIGPCGRGEAVVHDEFTVTGLPTGTPLNFIGRFDVSFTAGCILGPASAFAEISDDASHSSQIDLVDPCILAGGTMDSILVIPIATLAGTPFPMTYRVEAMANEAVVSVRGVFSFDGLPQDAVVTSCNGYVQGPVQVESTSWGRVKAHYR